MNGQIGGFNGMKAACQQLGTDCQKLAGSIAVVRNAVNFLVSDLLEVSNDLAAGDATVVIALMATAASTELATLARMRRSASSVRCIGRLHCGRLAR